MILNIDEFYNNNNYKQYVPLEAFQEEMRLVGETFLKDVKVKNVLSITYSIDDYGENPIYIEYLDENDQKHLVKLKPAIHEQLNSVLSKYATIDYVNQKFVEAVQTNKDYTDQAKEALTVLINGSKEEAIQVNKAYTDVEINKLNADLREYIDTRYDTLWQEIATYSDSAVADATNISKAYTDDEINKAKQEVKHYADSQDNTKLLESKEYADAKYTQALDAIETGDSQALEASKAYTDTKHREALTAIEEGDTQTLADSKAYTDTKHNEALTAIETGDTQTLADSKAYTDTKHNEALTAIETGDTQTLENSKAYTNAQLTNYELKTNAKAEHSKLSWVLPNQKLPYISWFPEIGSKYIRMVKDNDEIRFHINNSSTEKESIGYLSSRNPSTFTTTETVEALVQEQNATNTENVAVSLQQKARTTREATNNSTLVETKDFYILNLDFSFVPNVLPTSVESSFIENILIDDPEFNGKSFNVTFKANEHTATSKGVVGEPLNIKTCAIPIDETIKNVEVVVKDKIIIRKETE